MDAFHMLVDRLDAPEASAGEHDGLQGACRNRLIGGGRRNSGGRLGRLRNLPGDGHEAQG